MAGKSQVVEITISQLDWYVINQVKKLRRKKGLSQSDLSVEMGFSEKLIGSVENPTLNARFNIRHLNLLAKALDCTLWDLIPEKPFDNDLVKIKIKKSARITKAGSTSSKTEFEILEVKPLKNR
ncbi:MAG: helix-turn-helix transcriptional regulator [Bacteroidetes bacterium]|nr:helix-turn-helix transcriptional regulator [Bacteroidota bacterium]